MFDERMKGGIKYMGKNIKRFLMLGVLAMFMFMFTMQLVVAAKGTGVAAPVETDWITAFMDFLNLGTTWADLIVALAVLVMIFAAAYDIMGFTAFESDWVKYSIAGAIAVVTAVLGGVNAFAGVMMKIAGESIVVATTIVIIIAVVFFVGGSFFKGKMKRLRYKAKSEDVAGLMDLAAEAKAGDIKAAKKALEAGKGV